MKTFKSWLKGGTISKEHRDFILIKELYHCTPSELDEQEERVLAFHFQCLMQERKYENIESKKSEQATEVKKKLSSWK